MIIDKRTQFCDNEAAFGTAATRLEGSQIDLQTARDIANGQPIYLIVVITAQPGDNAGTINIQLVSDSTAAIATDGSATVHWQTGAQDDQYFTLGKTFCVALPLEGNAYEQFLGILVVTAAQTSTLLAFDAFLSLDPVGWKAYADAAS